MQAKPVALKPFEKIDVLMENASLCIKKSKSGAFELCNPASVPLAYQIENQTFSLIQKQSGPHTYLELHLPDYAHIRLLRVRIERGSLKLKHAGFEQANVHLYQGNLKLDKVQMLGGRILLDDGIFLAEGSRLADMEIHVQTK